MKPNADGVLGVLDALLAGGADPNERCRPADSRWHWWTPTLLAAQAGDLDAFERLLAHGGDPQQSLCPPTRSRRFDALYLAVTNGHGSTAARLAESHF